MSGKRYILDEFQEPPPSAWTSENEHKLEELKKMEFDWADTTAGRLEQTKKMELHAAVGKWTRKRETSCGRSWSWQMRMRMRMLNECSANIN